MYIYDIKMLVDTYVLCTGIQPIQILTTVQYVRNTHAWKHCMNTIY